MKSALCFVLSIIISIAIFSTADGALFDKEAFGTHPVTVKTISEEGSAPRALFDSPEYYGRSALTGLENSEALLFAYDSIVAGVEKCEEEISLYNGTEFLTKEEALTAYNAYRYDRTEHFWLGNTYTLFTVGENATSIKPTYTMTGDKLAFAKEKFNEVTNEILSLINAEMSEFERELIIHDELARRVNYVVAAPNAHNAYGALVEGAAVCEGYAESFSHLLYLAGIQSFIVTGDSVNPFTGKSEGHAWNIVRIDGSYYHSDVTWNDQGKHTFHAYFNQPDSVIFEDHKLDDSLYPIPACTDKEASYFTVVEGFLDSPYDIEKIAELLKKNAFSAHIYIEGDALQFAEWFYANIKSIATAAGVTGDFSYGYGCLAGECVLIITPSAVFSKVSLSIDVNMSFNYYVRADSLENFNANNLAVKFTFLGESITVKSWSIKDGEFVFSLDYIHFQYMCENIDAELILIAYDGGSQRSIGEKRAYSIKKYCTELLEIYGEESAEANLAGSLLNFGAQTQKYLNYKTDELPTDGIELPCFDVYPSVEDAALIEGNAVGRTYVKDAFLVYDHIYEGVFKICIDVYSETPGHAALSLRGGEIISTEDLGQTSEGTRRYTLAAKGVLGTDNFTRVELSDADIRIVLTFSLNSFIYESLGDTDGDMPPLFLLSRYRLGKAADTYAFLYEMRD